MAEETIKTLVLKLKTSVDKSSLNSAIKEIQGGLGDVADEAASFDGATKSVGAFAQGLKDVVSVGLKPLKWIIDSTGVSLDNMKTKVKGVASPLGVLKSTWKVMTAPLRNFSEGIKNATKRLGGFLSAIKRIAIYRAIRWALKKITEGFQEGVQNAYQWSVITGNQFAKSMDMMATSALYLKNSLGAMTMPLMNYLAPILDSLIDKFVDLINLVNQFVATFTGASSWVKALKYPAEFMEQAAGSAKELKNQLLGFDELNVLNAPSGGGSASALDYSGMFEQMTLDASKFSFATVLRNAIKKDDWKGVGAELGRKFNELINKFDAIKLAQTLGEKFNSALTMVHTFLYEADFEEVGKKITQFFTNLKLNWQMIGSNIFRWGTKMLDSIIGMIEGINWRNVANAVGNFFVGALNEISNYIKNVNWVKVIDTLATAIIDVIRGIPWWELAKSLANFFISMVQSAFSLLSAPIRKIWEWITGMSSIEQAINGLNSHASTGTSYTNGNQGNAITGSGNSHQHGEQNPFEGMFADGGFPSRGSMFIAGEVPEFVGNVGGRTGVYNADQMTVALANANEGVVETLTAVGNAIVNAINRKDTSINANDIRMAMRGMNLRYGV